MHITLTAFRNESRIEKEISTLKKFEVFNFCFVAAIEEAEVPTKSSEKADFILTRFYLRSKTWGKSITFQVIKYIEFSFRIYFFYRHHSIKVINIHALPLFPLGILLKLLFGALLVYDAHELETERVESKGFRKSLAKLLERFCIKYSDLNIVVSDKIGEWYAEKYNIPRPLVIYNGSCCETIVKSDHFRKKFGIAEDQIIGLYQGGISRSRGIELIVETFKARNDNSLVMVFLGYGDLAEQIEALASVSENIFFHPAVDRDVLLQYTASADFGVHLIPNNCLNHDYCLPNKLFEYAMAGLPVVFSNTSEVSALVLENKFGFILPGETVDSFDSILEGIKRCQLSELKTRARNFGLSYSWETQEDLLVSEYRQMLTR